MGFIENFIANLGEGLRGRREGLEANRERERQDKLMQFEEALARRQEEQHDLTQTVNSYLFEQQKRDDMRKQAKERFVTHLEMGGTAATFDWTEDEASAILGQPITKPEQEAVYAPRVKPRAAGTTTVTRGAPEGESKGEMDIIAAETSPFAPARPRMRDEQPIAYTEKPKGNAAPGMEWSKVRLNDGTTGYVQIPMQPMTEAERELRDRNRQDFFDLLNLFQGARQGLLGSAEADLLAGYFNRIGEGNWTGEDLRRVYSEIAEEREKKDQYGEWWESFNTGLDALSALYATGQDKAAEEIVRKVNAQYPGLLSADIVDELKRSAPVRLQKLEYKFQEWQLSRAFGGGGRKGGGGKDAAAPPSPTGFNFFTLSHASQQTIGKMLDMEGYSDWAANLIIQSAGGGGASGESIIGGTSGAPAAGKFEGVLPPE